MFGIRMFGTLHESELGQEELLFVVFIDGLYALVSFSLTHGRYHSFGFWVDYYVVLHTRLYRSVSASYR